MKRVRMAVIGYFCLLAIALMPLNASASIIASFSGSSWTTEEETVVYAAIAAWNSQLTISQNIVITFSLGTFNSSTLGATSISAATMDGRPTAASITIYTGTYGKYSIYWGTDESGLTAYTYDALSIIEHEIAHALGIAYIKGLRYYNAVELSSDGKTATVCGYKLYGTSGYGTSSSNTLSHLADSSDLMYPYITAGKRTDISDTDVDILCSVYGYKAVPLPASLLFLGPGLVALWGARRKKLAA